MKIIIECSVEEFKTLLKKEPQENEALQKQLEDLNRMVQSRINLLRNLTDNMEELLHSKYPVEERLHDNRKNT